MEPVDVEGAKERLKETGTLDVGRSTFDVLSCGGLTLVPKLSWGGARMGSGGHVSAWVDSVSAWPGG